MFAPSLRKGCGMKDQEELSVSEVLSSIKTAVLETKSPSFASLTKEAEKMPQKDRTVEDVFILSKDMLVCNSANSSLSESDFDKTSESLLRKYAKIFATWQAFEKNKKQ